MSIRVKIDRKGRATLCGLDYRALRSILTAAALYQYDQRESLPFAISGSEAHEYLDNELRLLKYLTDCVDSEILKTHSWRNDTPTKAQRLAKVLEARKSRRVIENLIADVIRVRIARSKQEERA